MKVSVWAGNASTWADLNSCLEFAFNEDGEAIPGPFARAFEIDWFDEDFREATVIDGHATSAKELFSRHSRGEEIAIALCHKVDLSNRLNATVAIFDFTYHGKVISAILDNVSLSFIGIVELPE